MANPPQIQLDPIKYLNNLPVFNGNTNDLQTFTKLIDRVHPILASYDELSQLLFSDIIKSRLVGRAKEIIEINTQVQSWADIKNTLYNNFGERKSSEQLFDELRAVTFQTNVVDFYNDIKNILRRLNNKMTATLGEGEAANQVAINNQRTALHVFKNKMPEPMKTILSCRNPSSLESAMDILYENQYDKIGKDGHFHPGRAKQNYNYQKNKNEPSSNFYKGRNYQRTQQNERQQQTQHQNFYRNNTHEPRWQNNQEQHQQNFYRNNTHEPRWRNNTEQYQQNAYGNNADERRLRNNYNHQQQPEPMEINNAENFQQEASTENYHI